MQCQDHEALYQACLKWMEFFNAPKPMLCERCYFDEIDRTADIAEIFQDRYQAVCRHCADEMHVQQYNMGS